jgi:hypothetical protein
VTHAGCRPSFPNKPLASQLVADQSSADDLGRPRLRLTENGFLQKSEIGLLKSD